MIGIQQWFRCVLAFAFALGCFGASSRPASSQALNKGLTTRPTRRSVKPTRLFPKRRRRRVRRKVKRIRLPAPSTMKTKEIIDDLKRRNWRRQSMLLDELVRRKKTSKALLYKAFRTHSHLRVRLLAAHALARLQDKRALPDLISMAQRWWDQPLPLTTGALLAYGQSAIPSILKAMKTSQKPHNLLHVLGMQRSAKALPWIRKYLLGNNKEVRQKALEALRNYSDDVILTQIETLLKKQPNVNLRSSLYRLIPFRQSVKVIPMLLVGMQDRSDAIRFLVRLSLQDKAEELQKKMPQKIKDVPKGASRRDPGAWAKWWKAHQPHIQAWFKQKRQQSLQSIPRQKIQRVLLVYRTIHPMFGYGRMPIIVHDTRWKKPPSPIPGKVWHVGLPSKIFAQLLRTMRRSGYTRWPQRMGSIRDITVFFGNASRKVSIGMIRHFPFETLERIFLQYTKKAKLALNFFDFYRRKDESDIVKQGQVGLWAYRKMDRIQVQAWTPRKSWKPLADLEGMVGVLRDTTRYMPSRTRLMFLDILQSRVRFSSLLYGSRSQSRYTRDGLSKSRRMKNFELQGIGVIYLITDKVEQMIFDLTRRPLPFSSRYAKPNKKTLPFLPTLSRLLRRKHTKMIAMSVFWGRPHRVLLTFKAKDAYTVRQVLAQFALHSAGDKVIAMRINQSGAPDRDLFSVVVQMQFEINGWVQPPKKRPASLTLDKAPSHSMFQPINR